MVGLARSRSATSLDRATRTWSASPGNRIYSAKSWRRTRSPSTAEPGTEGRFIWGFFRPPTSFRQKPVPKGPEASFRGIHAASTGHDCFLSHLDPGDADGGGAGDL